METYPRGMVVLAPDLYKDSGARPFVIISDDSYPFYPNGYLGVPVTGHDKTNTVEICERDIVEHYNGLDKKSYANPYSPAQVNDIHSKLCLLDETFMDILGDRMVAAVGGNL
jgi:hypothetical protein